MLSFRLNQSAFLPPTGLVTWRILSPGGWVRHPSGDRQREAKTRKIGAGSRFSPIFLLCLFYHLYRINYFCFLN